MDTLNLSKSSKAFEAVSNLSKQGVDPATIIASPLWKQLMDRLERSLEERVQTVTGIAERFVTRKRSNSDVTGPRVKRARTESPEEALARRKKELLKQANSVEVTRTEEDYEAYRQQSWRQYYEWLASQKLDEQAEDAKPEENQPSNVDDDDIMKQLLG